MKVAIVNSGQGATAVAMAPMLRHWRDLDVTELEAGALHQSELFEEYDIVHAPFIGNVFQWPDIYPPRTANIWHIPVVGGRMTPEFYSKHLNEFNYAHHFVDDGMTRQILGQMGITNVTEVPLVIDPENFSSTPAARGPFSVGTFTRAYTHKRVEAMQEGAARAGVRFWAFVRPLESRLFLLDPVLDVYATFHVYIHASFYDTNSLPAMEALACGRPVISTRNPGLARVLQHGENGYYFDGSEDDLAEKIKLAEKNYSKLVEGAKNTKFPSPQFAALQYENVWRKVVAADEL